MKPIKDIVKESAFMTLLADIQAKKQRRIEKERAGMLVCRRCKQITTLNVCCINDMEAGKEPNMQYECVALD